MIVYVTSLTVGGHRVMAVASSRRGVAEHIRTTLKSLRTDLEERVLLILEGARLSYTQKLSHAKKRADDEERDVLLFVGKWLERGQMEVIFCSEYVHLIIEKTFLKP